MPPPTPAERLKEAQDRIQFLMHADQHFAELVELLKNTNRILGTLANMVERLDRTINEVEKRVGPVVSVISRMNRLEEAALNIERATSAVEAAMGALPKMLRQRIARGGKPDTTKEA